MNKFDSVIKQLYRKQYSVIIQLNLVQVLFCDSAIKSIILDIRCLFKPQLIKV